MDFRVLPSGPRITLDNLTAPACLLDQPGDLTSLSLTIENGLIVDGPPGERVDMAHAMVFPAFVDMHTHLDKGHIWARSPNPDGTFMGALNTVAADREARWSAEDVRRRADGAEVVWCVEDGAGQTQQRLLAQQAVGEGDVGGHARRPEEHDVDLDHGALLRGSA